MAEENLTSPGTNPEFMGYFRGPIYLTIMKALLVTLLLVLVVSESYAQSKLKWVRTNHPTRTSAVSYSSDGKYLASTSMNANEVILWEGATSKFIRRFRTNAVSNIGGARFLPGGYELLVGGDSGIFAVNVESEGIRPILGGEYTRLVGSIDVSTTGDTIGWLSLTPHTFKPLMTYYLFALGANTLIDSLQMYIQGWEFGESRRGYLVSKDLRSLVYFNDHDSFRVRSPYIDTIFHNDVSKQYWLPFNLSADGSSLKLIDIKRDKIDSLYLPSMTLVAGVEKAPAELRTFQIRDHSEILNRTALADNEYWMTPEYGEDHGFILVVTGKDTTNITGVIGNLASSPIAVDVRAAGKMGIASYDYEGSLVMLDRAHGHGSFLPSFSSQGEFSFIREGDPYMNPDVAFVGERTYSHPWYYGMPCRNSPKIDPRGGRFALGETIHAFESKEVRLTCPLVTSEWTPSGSYYVWSPYGGRVFLRDTVDEIRSFPTMHGRVNDIAVTDHHIATAGRDGVVRVWNFDGSSVGELIGHTQSVYGVSFTPDGRKVVSASEDATVRAWTLDGRPIQTYDEFDEPFNSVVVSNDGFTIIASSDRSIVAFDASDWARVKPQQMSQHTLIARRTERGLSLQHSLGDGHTLQVEIYDLLGRLLYRGEHVSSDGHLTVPGQWPERTLLIRVKHGEISASAIVGG